MNLNSFVPLLEKIGIDNSDLSMKAEELKNNILKIDKESSAHFADVEVKDLPLKVQKEIERFADVSADTKLIHYGMVVKELLSKVDKHNFEQAEKHLKDEKINEDEFYKKLPNKYLLLVNDKLVDGHHYLARAKKLGVTSSLNVLDLSPVRFQEKKANTLWEKLANDIIKKDNKINRYDTFYDVSFKVNDYGLSEVMKVIEYLRWCGAVGHTCSLKDETKYVGGIDGDGSDRIKDLKVNGKAWKPPKK